MNRLLMLAACSGLLIPMLATRMPGQADTPPPSAAEPSPPQPVVIAATLPPPLTRVETLAASKGLVIIKGYSEPVILNGDDGSVLRLSAIDVRDGKDARRESGLVFSLRGAGGNDAETTAYVDRDEIDAMIDALDTLGKLDPAVAGMPNFEGTFRTRGDVVLANVDINGSRMLAIRATRVIPSAGEIGSANAIFRLSRLDELRRMLTDARDALAKLSAAGHTAP
jgi:hypothetical protein